MDKALAWCAAVLGPVEVLTDHSKVHGGHESSIRRLRSPRGFCYLKVHHSRAHWHNEVYAYRHWARAFGNFAPRLLAVREEAPLALVVSELSGRIVEQTQLSPAQERAVWRDAGAALVSLHNLGTGAHFGPNFGPSRHTDAEGGEMAQEATTYVAGKFERQMEQGIQAGLLTAEERATLRTAYELIPTFAGEPPIPCHRDYCAANWLVNDAGIWAGVIDFEFAHWDVRVADFSRDPEWAWIRRPDLVDAFFAGYGRSLTAAEAQQLLVAHAEYALGAILWGHEHAFYGFEREGRAALAHLATLFPRLPPNPSPML